jgi:nitroimidazol reductase NimA-like FMN-containing flavoprotein (pyridoxamine 5'-phosphate oxidase superfamily)
MRKMTHEEIHRGLSYGRWATICTVSAQSTPYAVEATYFTFEDGIGFMINPRGTTARNLCENPNVLIKVTLADSALDCWAGISCFGRGEFETNREAIRDGWAMLGQVMRQDYSKAAQRFCSKETASPFLRVNIKKLTGRCSAAPGQALSFAAMCDPKECN